MLKYDLLKKIHRYHLDGFDLLPDDPIRIKLRQIIIMDEGFRDSTISLKKLLETLSISPSKASIYIQAEFCKSFPDLIGHLRLQYVVARMKTSENSEKMESIAYDAGFQSPSSFYAHFKPAFKSTPSEY